MITFINMEYALNLTETNNRTNVSMLVLKEMSNTSFNNNAINSVNLLGENFLNMLSVQIFLIIMYSLVFCCCFIGKFHTKDI